MPVLAVPGVLKTWQEPFEIEGDNIVVDAIKKAEDGNRIIIRLHETSGGKSEVNLKLNFKFERWSEGSLMEEAIGDWYKVDKIKRTLSGYELYTIIVEL